MSKLDQLLEAKGLTQTELAFRARVHPSLISRLRTGKGRPGTDGMLRVAQELGIDLNELQELLKPEPATNGTEHAGNGKENGGRA